MKFVEDNHLKAVFPYIDNITIGGKDQDDHDTNLKLFQEAAQRANLKFNDSKSVFSSQRLPIADCCYSFDIVYRPGKENVAPDTFSRATCASSAHDSLYKLHDSLCHPGITQFWDFIRE